MTYREQCGPDEGPFPYYAAWFRAECERLKGEVGEAQTIADEAIMDNAVLGEENSRLKRALRGAVADADYLMLERDDLRRQFDVYREYTAAVTRQLMIERRSGPTPGAPGTEGTKVHKEWKQGRIVRFNWGNK